MTGRCSISMLPSHTQMTSCLNRLSNSMWLPVDTSGWFLGDHDRHELYMIESPVWWDHQLALLSMCIGRRTLAVSEGSLAFGGAWSTFGEPLSLQHVWFLQGTENNVSTIHGVKRACKWERRDLLDASSADKPEIVLTARVRNRKAGVKEATLLPISFTYSTERHTRLHTDHQFTVSWLGGLLWVFWRIPQCYSRTCTKHLTFPLPLSCSYQLKEAPIAMNVHFSPCEKFHFNKPAERLVCYPLSWKGLMSHLCPWGQNASKELFQF